MEKIKAFFRKYAWAFILIIIFIAYMIDIYLTKQKPEGVAPTPAPIIATFKSIQPGISTEADLNKVLGTPIKTSTTGNQKLDEYRSTSELRLHEGIIENGRVVFIKEIISAHDKNDASSIVNIYGEAPNVLYSPYENATFNLYIYPSSGIAYLGSKNGTLLEIWYFIPTNFSEFQSKWASDYLTSPPANQSQ